MSRIAKNPLIKIVSVLVIISFLALDISWAYPSDQHSYNNIAAEIMSQRKMMVEANTAWKTSIFGVEKNLVFSVHTIAQALFDKKIPFELLESYVSDWQAFNNQNITTGIELSKIGPLGAFKKVIEEGYSQDFFPEFMPENDVIVIPYTRIDNEQILILVAKKDNPSAENLAGFDWLWNKYAVKILTKNDTNLEKPHPRVQEIQRVKVTEPVAEVEMPAGQGTVEQKEPDAEPVQTPNIKVIIRKILPVLILFLPGCGANKDVTFLDCVSWGGIIVAIIACVGLVLAVRKYGTLSEAKVHLYVWLSRGMPALGEFFQGKLIQAYSENIPYLE
ncbi:MAG: hypothetical protein PHW46_00445, partial [Candidatus Omnitrophica bacterium]|nr:hypothetical protein [Candidatus Omnitrophota bacterium]